MLTYDASIAFRDDSFGKLLEEHDRRGRLDDTVVVVTSDHGEAFCEHAIWTHRNSMFEELLHVRLVIRGPGIGARRASSRVSLLGIAPTLLALAGYERVGQEIFRRGARIYPPPTEDQPCHARLLHEGAVHLALIEDGVKWVVATRGDEDVELAFDLRRDPGERHDLTAGNAGAASETRARLMRRTKAEESIRLEGDRVTITRDLVESLKGMGYLR